MAAILQNGALLYGGLFACVMLLCGALGVGIGLFALQRHRAMAGWPQTLAVIEISDVLAERHFEGALMYRPVVRYRYAAPGGSFFGDKLATTGRVYPKEAAARRVVARYPVGTSVLARYNPADPAEVLLERDLSGAIWFILFGLLCWIAPVIVAIKAGLSWQLIAGVLGALVILLAALLLQGRTSKLQQARSRGLYPPAGSGSDADVAALAGRGEKLLAIRLYRELHGGGLKEARKAVEALVDTRPHQP